MFGSLGDLTGILKQAGQLRENMSKMQEELSKLSFESESGGGMVKAVVNGRGELLDIRIDKRAIDDIELLEDLVKGAVASATRKAQEGAKAEMSKLTGGLNIPGLEQMLGGG